MAEWLQGYTDIDRYDARAAMTGSRGSTGSMPSETWSRNQARYLARHVKYHLATWANNFWSISWSGLTVKYIVEL